jgi:tetratricopeptide (TPR) repeat protein
VLERLNSPAEALSLYQKAVALDRGRVAREPDRGVWRLDLSFGLASIGGLLSSQGDLQGARENYLQAVELRQAVVAAEPEDVFAASSLARGYERIAAVTGRMGRVGEAIGWHRQRADLFGARALAHPERDTLWRDYASALVDAVSFALTLLESAATPYPARKEAIPHVQRMLDSLGATISRWSHEHRPGQPPVPHNVLETLSHRLRELRSR